MFCDRPTERATDFEAARFIVASAYGLTINGERLERGSEVPADALEPRFLKLEYRARRIETAEFAKTDPDLCEACIRAGVNLDAAPPAASKPTDDLDKLSRRELSLLCERRGLNAQGNSQQLKDRLRLPALVG